MPRVARADLSLSTIHFTPTQLAPRVLLEASMAGWSQWMRENLVPFRELVGTHGYGCVIVAIALDWLEPFTFFDGDMLAVTTTVATKPDGSMLRSRFQFSSGQFTPAEGRATTQTVKIMSEDLAAAPAALAPDLVARFSADEIEPLEDIVRSRALGVQVPDDAAQVLAGTRQFRISRSDCEVADQWSAVEIAQLVAASREELLLACDRPELRRLLGRPIRRLRMAISRPLYIFDSARVSTQVFQAGEEILFRHRIESGSARVRTHATVLEAFQAS